MMEGDLFVVLYNSAAESSTVKHCGASSMAIHRLRCLRSGHALVCAGHAMSLGKISLACHLLAMPRRSSLTR